MNRLEFRAEPEDDGARLDVVIAARTELSRSQARTALDDGRVRVSGVTPTKASAKVAAGDEITIDVPDARPPTLQPQDLGVDVVYQDDHVIVVFKPAGMVVHPGPGHTEGTLVNALLHLCDGNLAGVGGELRPGIVHRIDRDTSGLLVATKTDEAHAHLQAQFAAHTVKREYRALCARTSGPGLYDEGSFATRHGRHPTDRLRFTGARGPRRAVTHYRVLERFEHGAVHLACRLETGRTHQIRMHLSEAGAPILGDPLYGGRAAATTQLIDRLALHARSLGFTVPDGRSLYFEAEPPEDFTRALEKLRRGMSWRK